MTSVDGALGEKSRLSSGSGRELAAKNKSPEHVSDFGVDEMRSVSLITGEHGPC